MYRYGERSGPTRLPDAVSVWPKPWEPGQDLRRLGRPAGAETFEDLCREAETFEDLCREAEAFEDLCREAGTLEGLAETAKDHRDLADGGPAPWEFGRWPNPITINAQTEISEANPSSRIR